MSTKKEQSGDNFLLKKIRIIRAITKAARRQWEITLNYERKLSPN